MATCYDISKSISLSSWRQAREVGKATAARGEFLAVRLPDMDLDHVSSEFALYLFDDGGMKAIGAALAWVGCVYALGAESEESLRHPRLVSLVRDLLHIPTLCKMQDDDPLTSSIRRIASQNIDAKKLPVSSFEWSEVLLRVSEASCAAEAIRRYNSMPEVDTGEKSASGTVMIDAKKTYAIKHWMEKCCNEARTVVYESLQDSPFPYGPWGEQLSLMPQLFLQSTAEQSCTGDSALAPLAHEESVSVNWALPLTEWAQTMLFRRIKVAFDRATAIIFDVRDKKKYRMKSEELVSLRNLCSFWSQVRSFCMTRIADFETFEKKLLNGSAMDDQFGEVMTACPRQFATSMMPMFQVQAACDLKRQEETSTMEAEQQRAELRAARWKYFQSALARDQKQLSLVSAAPDKIEKLRHRKEMNFRVEQAKVGEKVVLSFCEKYLRCRLVKQMEHFHEALHEFRSYVANDCGVPVTEVHIVGFTDLNVPLANSKERVQELMAAIAAMNDIAPNKHCAVVELADCPKKSSKRGLFDEEKDLLEELWQLKQQGDFRWILPWEVQPAAEGHSSRRRWSSGRVVVNKDAEETNIFTTSAELVLAGRPLTEQKIFIPLSKDLVLPESLEAHEDLRTAERQRPSPEAIHAQKGSERYMALIRFILSIPGAGFGKSPVIIVNLTGYVEEMGLAVLQHRLNKSTFGAFSCENLRYLSVSWIGKDTFGHSRLQREVLTAWLQKKLDYGSEYADVAPQLTSEEIKTIPGGEAFFQGMDTLKWEVLQRENSRMVIKPDEHRYWAAQTGEISETYKNLKAEHERLLDTMPGVGAPFSDGCQAGEVEQEPSTEATSLTTKDSLDALKEAEGIEFQTASEVSGIQLLLTKSKQVWIMATDKDRQLNKHTQLGGFGAGSYCKSVDCGEGLSWKLDLGDRTTVQVDETSIRENTPTGAVATMTLYSLLIQLERTKGVTSHKLSYFKVTRKDDVEAGSDAFLVEQTEQMKFKIQPPKDDAKLNCKHFFGKCVAAVEHEAGSHLIAKMFRLRFEPVGLSLKLQKPYVVSSVSISLSKGKPVKVADSP
ncbi:Uncharacterized protein SCF082_LOCUS31722 [Durusdinium trenchii]|uniref:Uncharacterized protein n=1 Tax=Durusdinium trenchii TaxID=1381693 RepID=A0ABP0N8S3_9DINO